MAAVQLIHIGTDLMMASAMGAAARRAGVSFRSVTSVAAMAALLQSAGPPRLIVIDLQTPGMDVAACGAMLADGVAPPATIVWFAQHVLGDLLDQARESGVGEVLTRGQLHARIDQIVSEAATR